MSPTFKNDYAANGKELRAASRALAGNRCIRCGHPYPPMKRADRGEWSDCDEECTHKGPFRWRYHESDEWDLSHIEVDSPFSPEAGEACQHATVQARWRILTVHHLDGDKANDQWFNLLALCQRCHLSFQTKVNPEVPYFFEHSDWFKPYAAGFYAKKYLGLNLTREQVVERMGELLALELLLPAR